MSIYHHDLSTVWLRSVLNSCYKVSFICILYVLSLFIYICVLCTCYIFFPFVCTCREILTHRGLRILDSGKHLETLAGDEEYYEESVGAQ